MNSLYLVIDQDNVDWGWFEASSEEDAIAQCSRYTGKHLVAIEMWCLRLWVAAYNSYPSYHELSTRNCGLCCRVFWVTMGFS